MTTDNGESATSKLTFANLSKSNISKILRISVTMPLGQMTKDYQLTVVYPTRVTVQRYCYYVSVYIHKQVMLLRKMFPINGKNYIRNT